MVKTPIPLSAHAAMGFHIFFGAGFSKVPDTETVHIDQRKKYVAGGFFGHPFSPLL